MGDAVLRETRQAIGDRLAGFSANAGYTVNVGGWCSLGMVDEAGAVDGTEVTLVWGEENGGTKKVTVERHKQVEVRVKVSVTPYGSVARETYHQGWRNRTA